MNLKKWFAKLTQPKPEKKGKGIKGEVPAWGQAGSPLVPCREVFPHSSRDRDEINRQIDAALGL